MIPSNRNGFSTIALSIVIIFFFLFLIILIQDIKLTDKNQKIETIKQEKIVAISIGDNKEFTAEHKAIDKTIKKEVNVEEVNLSNGVHTITFGVYREN